MINDHDRCKWVNVSSGIGSPGLSRTKSREPLNGCSSNYSSFFIAFIVLTPFVGHHMLPSVLWHCRLVSRKGIRRLKNWLVGCWRGCMCGSRCRFAYDPPDATVTHYILLQ